MSEWCEHIKILGNKYVIFNVKSIWEGIDFNFCPVCGIPRPSEPKKLADKLQETFRNHIRRKDDGGCNPDSSCMMGNIGDAAKEWFVELVKSVPKPGDCYDSDASRAIPWFKSELLKKIRETE